MTETASAKSGYRASLVGCLSILVVAAIGMTAWVWWDSSRGWTVARLEQLIQAEVPADCDRAQAEAWFDEHGIQHCYIQDTTGDRTGDRTMPMLAGLRDRDLSGMVRGSIHDPETNVGFIQAGDIDVYFFFDKQGRCVGHLVEPFVYWP